MLTGNVLLVMFINLISCLFVQDTNKFPFIGSVKLSDSEFNSHQLLLAGYSFHNTEWPIAQFHLRLCPIKTSVFHPTCSLNNNTNQQKEVEFCFEWVHVQLPV